MICMSKAINYCQLMYLTIFGIMCLEIYWIDPSHFLSSSLKKSK